MKPAAAACRPAASSTPRSVTPTLRAPGSLLLLALLALPPLPASAATNTWQGFVDSAWETPSNWSLGHVPLPGEDVVIPAGSPALTVNGSEKVVRSLAVQDDPLIFLFPKITSGAGLGVWLTAAQNVYIGDGIRVQSGGGILIGAGGDLTTRYLMFAAAGGSGSKGADGYDIELRGAHVQLGVLVAGNGGASGGPGLEGGNGGDIRIEASISASVGACSGGGGGSGAPAGRSGLVTVHAVSQVTLRPGASGDVSGGRIMIETDPGGAIVATGLSEQQVHAQAGVCLSAGSMASTIDLRGDQPDALQSDEGTIRLHGDVLLDGGVTLADLTQPDGVATATPCDVNVPATFPAALAALALLMFWGGSVVLLRSGQGARARGTRVAEPRS